MAHRQIKGLSWARALPERPGFIPQSRPRKGTKAQGLSYEKLVAKALPQAKHGVWFAYQDKNGPGWCQPDLLLALAGRIFVIEVKLTDTPEAYSQLQHLYLPVVGLALQRPTFGLVIAKNLTSSSPQRHAARGTRHGFSIHAIHSELASALTAADAGAVPLLHWLGKTPLMEGLATPNNSAWTKGDIELAKGLALA